MKLKKKKTCLNVYKVPTSVHRVRRVNNSDPIVLPLKSVKFFRIFNELPICDSSRLDSSVVHAENTVLNDVR